MECPVCVEPFNKRAHSRVTCGPCGFEACHVCVGAYLCASTQEAHCMSCKRKWDAAALRTCGLTQAFVNSTYRESREHNLWEREQARLPESQVLAEAIKASAPVRERLHYLLAAELEYLGDRAPKHRHLGLASCFSPFTGDIRRARELLARHNNHIQLLAQGMETNLDMDSEASDKGASKRRFVQRCPAEGCNGFIDNKYTCGLCTMRLCRVCRVGVGYTKTEEQKKEDRAAKRAAVRAGLEVAPAHECNPDIVASVRALADDTRPCPGCATPIFKIEGCDQMWCTECHVAFSWATGSKLKSTAIHNPHYYQWMRSGSRAPRVGVVGAEGAGAGAGVGAGAALMPDPCCAGAAEDALPPVVNSYVDYEGCAEVHNVHRCITEIREERFYLPRQCFGPQDEQAAMIRARFLLGTYDRDEFMRQTFLWDRTLTRKREVADVLRMFCTVGAGLLHRFTETSSRAANRALLDELDSLRQYTNDAMRAVAKLYNVTAVHIEPSYTITKHMHLRPAPAVKATAATAATTSRPPKSSTEKGRRGRTPVS